MSRCSICLDELGSERPVRQVLLCGHQFHSECLLDWARQKESCPNCKKQFDKKALREFEQKKADSQVCEKTRLREFEAPRATPGLPDPRDSAALLVSDHSRPALLAPSPIVRITRTGLGAPPGASSEAHSGRSRARMPSTVSLSRSFAGRRLSRPVAQQEPPVLQPQPAAVSLQPVPALPELDDINIE